MDGNSEKIIIGSKKDQQSVINTTLAVEHYNSFLTSIVPYKEIAIC